MADFNFDNYPYSLIDEVTFKDGEPQRVQPDAVAAGEILSLRAHYEAQPGNFYRIWMQIESVRAANTGGFAVTAALALSEDLPLNIVHFDADALLQKIGNEPNWAYAYGYISNADTAIGGGFDAELVALTKQNSLCAV